MSNKNLGNYYDVVYKTTSGRAMIAKRVAAKTAEEAKKKVIKDMRKSSTFSNVVTAMKL